ncbi:MAG TPA: cupin domain-containing protein [Solirubrobacterales bacterium]|nr:cupin domain-containing protein [Solirubrobacterales bacterium]
MLWVKMHPKGSTGEERVVSQCRCESVYVLHGRLRFELGDQEFLLDKGSCLTFQGHVPHRCENRGKSDAELLWITSPAAS